MALDMNVLLVTFGLWSSSSNYTVKNIELYLFQIVSFTCFVWL